jgi:hypothetical protein
MFRGLRESWQKNNLCDASRDNVEWNEEQQKFAEDATMKQAANPVPDEMKGEPVLRSHPTKK